MACPSVWHGHPLARAGLASPSGAPRAVRPSAFPEGSRIDLCPLDRSSGDLRASFGRLPQYVLQAPLVHEVLPVGGGVFSNRLSRWQAGDTGNPVGTLEREYLVYLFGGEACGS